MTTHDNVYDLAAQRRKCSPGLAAEIDALLAVNRCIDVVESSLASVIAAVEQTNDLRRTVAAAAEAGEKARRASYDGPLDAHFVLQAALSAAERAQSASMVGQLAAVGGDGVGNGADRAGVAVRVHGQRLDSVGQFLLGFGHRALSVRHGGDDLLDLNEVEVPLVQYVGKLRQRHQLLLNPLVDLSAQFLVRVGCLIRRVAHGSSPSLVGRTSKGKAATGSSDPVAPAGGESL